MLCSLLFVARCDGSLFVGCYALLCLFAMFCCSLRLVVVCCVLLLFCDALFVVARVVFC